jgi:hypothetical protein
MSKRLRPAFAVTEAAVALTADEKVARTRYEGVTGVARGFPLRGSSRVAGDEVQYIIILAPTYCKPHSSVL